MKKRAFSMVGLLSVLALLLSGCGTSEQEQKPAVQEQQTEQTSVFLEKCSLTLPVCTVSLNTPDNELAIQEKYGLTLDEWNALANDSDSFGYSRVFGSGRQCECRSHDYGKWCYRYGVSDRQAHRNQVGQWRSMLCRWVIRIFERR